MVKNQQKEEQSSFSWIGGGIGALVSAPVTYFWQRSRELPKVAKHQQDAGIKTTNQEALEKFSNSPEVKQKTNLLNKIGAYRESLSANVLEYVKENDKWKMNSYKINANSSDRNGVLITSISDLSWEQLPDSVRAQYIRGRNDSILFSKPEDIQRIIGKETLVNRLLPELERAEHHFNKAYAKAYGLGFKDLTGWQKVKVTGVTAAAAVGIGTLAGMLMGGESQRVRFASRVASERESVEKSAAIN